MSNHTITLYGDHRDERQAVFTLGRVLSRYFDALPDTQVTAMVREAAQYSGAFGFSEAFSLLDLLAMRHGVLWTLDNDGTFTVSF
jgi:hypothetical protein